MKYLSIILPPFLVLLVYPFKVAMLFFLLLLGEIFVQQLIVKRLNKKEVKKQQMISFFTLLLSQLSLGLKIDTIFNTFIKENNINTSQEDETIISRLDGIVRYFDHPFSDAFYQMALDNSHSQGYHKILNNIWSLLEAEKKNDKCAFMQKAFLLLNSSILTFLMLELVLKLIFKRLDSLMVSTPFYSLSLLLMSLLFCYFTYYIKSEEKSTKKKKEDEALYLFYFYYLGYGANNTPQDAFNKAKTVLGTKDLINYEELVEKSKMLKLIKYQEMLLDTRLFAKDIALFVYQTCHYNDFMQDKIDLSLPNKLEEVLTIKHDYTRLKNVLEGFVLIQLILYFYFIFMVWG